MTGLENSRTLTFAETPQKLTIQLLKHQQQGLDWMSKQEDSRMKGGILADEMGLGKTIQSIALMLRNPSNDPDRKPNLIVGPVAVIEQVLLFDCSFMFALYLTNLVSLYHSSGMEKLRKRPHGEPSPA